MVQGSDVSASPAARSGLTGGRKLAFSLLLIGLLGVAVEVLAHAGIYLAQGSAFSPSESRRQKAEIAGPVEFVEAAGGADGRSPRWLEWMVLHPFFGFVADPATNIVEVDPQGFMTRGEWTSGDDLEFAATEDDFVVAVLGGSVARGLSLKAYDTLAAEIAQAPALGGRRVAVRNLALSGYKQPQQLMILSYLLALGERFDIVINLDGFNEVAIPFRDNVRSGVYPFYPRAWPLWAGTAHGLSTQRLIGIIAYQQERRARLAGLCPGPLAYSATCEVVWRLLDRPLGRRLYEARRQLTEAAGADRSFRTNGPAFPDLPTDELFEELASYWRRTSLLMHQLCRENDIRYFHFLQPNQYVEGSKPMGEEEKSVALSTDPTYDYREAVRAGYPRLVSAGQRLAADGVSFHDLRMIYADHPEPLYIDRCCHVSPQGNRLLATEIARRIVGELSASESADPGAGVEASRNE